MSGAVLLLLIPTVAILLPVRPEAPALGLTVHSGPIVVQDIVVGKGGGRDIHAEIAFLKNSDRPMPAIIYMHGGGWEKGTYKISPLPQFAALGYFGLSIDYRLADEAKWPAQIQDCKLGVRWLRANAATYHVDPNRIGAWGDSAGGHLAACLGTMADVKEFEGDGGYPGVSSAVQAVVDFYEPIDFSNPAIWFNPKALFAVPFEQDPTLWKSASPLTYLKPGAPPFYIGHGDSDRIVPLANSVEFDAALTAAGVPHQFRIVKNADHGFRPMPGTAIIPTFHEIQVETFTFVAKYLKPQ